MNQIALVILAPTLVNTEPTALPDPADPSYCGQRHQCRNQRVLDNVLAALIIQKMRQDLLLSCSFPHFLYAEHSELTIHLHPRGELTRQPGQRRHQLDCVG